MLSHSSRASRKKSSSKGIRYRVRLTRRLFASTLGFKVPTGEGSSRQCGGVLPNDPRKAFLCFESEARFTSILSMFPDPIAVATSSLLSNDLYDAHVPLAAGRVDVTGQMVCLAG
jgi:hypothetical protein